MSLCLKANQVFIYSADTGAAIAYRHFKDGFQKVVNYVDKLIVAMEKDIKDAEAKAQSSQ